MKFPIHKDSRGTFQELAHDSDVKFGQLSLLRVQPGCARGGHYHTYKQEWFCCIRGWCLMDITNVQTGEERTINLKSKESEFVYIAPYERHTVRNNSRNVCELLVIISEAYNKENPDTEIV